MSLRISSAAISAALLTACATESPAPEGDMIDCAIGPGADYSKVCTLEVRNDGEFLIHSPDGGFRRFTWGEAGGVRSTDGADPVISERVSLPGLGSSNETSILEFELATDKYRFDEALISSR